MSKNHSQTMPHNAQFEANTHAIMAGILSSFAYFYMAYYSRSYGDLELGQFLLASLVCVIASFWVWHIHNRNKLEINLTVLLMFAVLFRLIGGFTFPILEDDFYRYLWDARQTVETGSPYGIAPADFFGDPNLNDRFESILSGINYPYVETVYGPTCQWLFALAYLIAPGEIWPLQLFMGIADILLVLLLLKLANPTSVLLYAWSPLIIKEFVITTHPDVIGVLFVLVSLLLLNKRYLVGLGMCMAIACGVKIFAVILLPFLLRFEWKAWLGFVVTAILIALPFGLVQAWLPSGLSTMGSNWLFNAPIYLFAEATIGSLVTLNSVKFTLIGLLAVGCTAYLIHYLKKGPNVVAHRELRGDLLYAGLFLCAPAFNAWYLVWLLLFAVFRPSLWAWLMSATILLSYASGINLSSSALGPYEHSGWLVALEFTPPMLAAALLVWKITVRKQGL